MMRLQRILAGVVLGSLPFHPAFAERAARTLSNVTTIEDAEGHSRILVSFSPGVNAEHYAIRQAVLKFNLAGEPSERAISLNIHPIKTAWNPATVSWTNGWRTPGGDFDETMIAAAEIQLSRGAGPVAVDITRAMKEILENGEQWNGIIMTTDPREGIGIDSDDVARFSNLANATIDVSWRKVPPKPIELQHEDTVGGNQ